MLDDKFIGLALAASSSLLIGISFIITKKGLMDSAYQDDDETAGDTFAYLYNPTWWAGMITMIFGEIANFAAYSFAPAILVTPLGALSVLVSATLASWLLQERLGNVGKAGCALCLIGSVMIVLHAPEDKEITSVDEILYYALQPAFLFYCLFVLVFSLYMIYKVAPKWGKYNILVYISICSLVGSVSVMAVKGFGEALKLTLAGNNQLTHPSTYVFAIIVTVCILTQMNYFNKALDTFSTNLVNPIYYVFFTTATIIASVTLFQGFNEASPVDIASLFCGFSTIFIGVFLLNSTRIDRRSSTVLSRLSARSRRGSRIGVGSHSLGFPRVLVQNSSSPLSLLQPPSSQDFNEAGGRGGGGR
ncbi:MAG: magnesium transporter [Piptocephalis tieghemiana]|nr:MAG: magnesium transporter [Piptocephalis tieghemiana]